MVDAFGQVFRLVPNYLVAFPFANRTVAFCTTCQIIVVTEHTAAGTALAFLLLKNKLPNSFIPKSDAKVGFNLIKMNY